MRVTPIDIQHREFPIKFRGFDKEEVNAFLKEVTEEYEVLIKENNRLREDLAGKEIQLIELRKKEETLNNTLLNVQRLVEDLKANAQREASLIIKEAELKAEEIKKDAEQSLFGLKKELTDLKRQKALFIEKFKGLMEGFKRALEIEEGEEAEESL